MILDAEVELCALTKKYLEREGFLVEDVREGKQGIARALAGDYALIILDAELTGVSGIEALRRIRAESGVPVIMLTERGEEVDRIVALEIGADDSLSKPFNPRELVARARAILRRTRQVSPIPSSVLPSEPPLVIGEVVLDRNTRKVRRAGKTLELTGLEFKLLEVLMRAVGRVVTREELAQIVLGREFDPYDRNVKMHVSNLRKKLGPKKGCELIQTTRGVGYLFIRHGEESRKK